VCPIVLGFLESALRLPTIPQSDRFWALLPRLSHTESQARKTLNARTEVFAWRALAGPIAQTLVDGGLRRHGQKLHELREFEWLQAIQWIFRAWERDQVSRSRTSIPAHQAVLHALTIVGQLERNPVRVASIAGSVMVSAGDWDLLFVSVEDALKL
jgi:hypothetical protein